MHRSLAASAIVLSLSSCRGAPERVEPADSEVERGNGIVVCGRRFPIDATVVPWFEEPGYSAYQPHPHFGNEGPPGLRYRPGRDVADPLLQARVDDRGFELEELAGVVDLLVLHYDACGTSRRCFEVLQDLRGLSVHFLLDLDGTIYQTLDLQEQAWHVAQANPRSIGVEIAHIGAFAPGEASPLDAWYGEDGQGTRIRIPRPRGDGGIRTAGFVGRPAREGRIEGRIQGELFEQVDFTPEQYESLVALAAALCRILPRIEPVAPGDGAGGVRRDALDEEELRAFSGILGHFHVTKRKRDPGPAFDWERFLGGVRRELKAPGRPPAAVPPRPRAAAPPPRARGGGRASPQRP